MFELINDDGKKASLAINTSIPIERNNPLFGDSDSFFQDVSYSFDLPINPINIDFLKNGHLLEAKKSVYELNVQAFRFGTAIYAGKLRYSLQKNSFKALLMVNFGAVAEKVSKVKMSEIYTLDGYYNGVTPNYMKTVCSNPLQYPYSFFPVYNEGWIQDQNSNFNPMINPWDHATQSFSSQIGSTIRNAILTCPWWKAKYLLIKAMEYLGLGCEGSWIDDPETDYIYIYSRNSNIQILDSVLSLPLDLKISDYIKILQERFKLNFEFNLSSGKVSVNSLSSITNRADAENISHFVRSIDEISIPEKKGFSVILKPDDDDDLFLDPVENDESRHLPTNRLVVGNGETEIVLESSTLKSKREGEYSMPFTKQKVGAGSIEFETFQIRFIYFNGMKSLSGGKIFPEAKPMELSEQDFLFYQILNDGKPVKLTALLPVEILDKLTNSTKIAFTSAQGYYTEALLKKVSSSIKNDNVPVALATIECHTLSRTIDTQIYLEPVFTALSEDVFRPKVTAYFSKESGVAEVRIKVHYENINDSETGVAVPMREYDGIIKSSTDAFGVGGSKINFPVVGINRQSIKELRIYGVTPRYGVAYGQKFNFLTRDDYYYCNIGRYADQRGVWIVV